ncbi:MAG: alpha-glucosidase C-terminal domain-containing protein, partial [Lachnospiraceae bacterium]|nr:alpha-glucosidase C-terminal domain-containing protein [Lachnospiraceae bacterium]
MERTQKRMEPIGLIGTVLENHDLPRVTNRLLHKEDRIDAAKKLLAVLYLYQKGIPFIYQGQELGMENTFNPDVRSMQDVSSHDEYRVCKEAGLSEEEAVRIVNHYSRDNARTPFQWDDSANAGFTTGTPWLAVNPNYKSINAASQVADANSVYHFYRRAIALRKHPSYANTFVYGVFAGVETEDANVIAYTRTTEEQTILVICNFQHQDASCKVPSGTVLLDNYEDTDMADGTISLRPFEAVVLLVTT